MIHHVRDKALLEGIRRGDRVEITVTRARAVSIERARR
jgi:Cu/Ag efflux protein CusF